MSILDNLNNLGKKAQEYAGVAVDKAKDLAEVAADKAKNATDTAKLNMAILTEQRELEKNYRAIGEWFISEYTGEIPDAVKDVVAAVNASKARIAEMEAEKASKSAAPAAVAVIRIVSESLLEMFRGAGIPQIQRFTAEGGGLPLGVAICLEVWYK